MKKYNKSRIMQLANHKRKHDNLTMSQALTLAWIEARRNEYYQVIEVRKSRRTSIGFEMNLLADSLRNYYANNTYNGD
jgi:hypothetical protein